MSSSLALAADERVRLVIQSLPALSADALPSLDDACPICLLPFKVILSDERNRSRSVEMDGGVLMVRNSPMPDEYAGVTKSPGCGHLFCKRDLAEWISSWHGTCPACRHPFLDIKAPSESDDESSDGGEWLPEEHEELDEAEDFDVWDDGDASELDLDADLHDVEARDATESDYIDTDADWDIASSCGATTDHEEPGADAEP